MGKKRKGLFTGCSYSQITDTVELEELNDELMNEKLILNTVATGVPIYIISDPYCVDCRGKGGTNIKPDFWE
ncbi:MAG: hypothetical protein HC906_10130 [Bacteroidales bacterium]|nr:hypothetical protein [Bacteroidales bacterium]